LQTKPHAALVHVAEVALGGTPHGVHAVPQEFTLESSAHMPLQS
jgi:hypothetical protein